MGRPPLKTNVETKPTMVRLPEDTRQRIEDLVGPNRMAAFIREAIENELKRRARQAKDEKPSQD
jgi:predicted DNA-binding protein